MMPNLLQYPVTMFGALRAGMTVVNVNPLYTARELQHQLEDSGAKVIVVLENFAHTLQEVLDKTAVKYVITTRIGDLLSFPTGMIANLAVKYLKGLVPAWDIPGRWISRAPSPAASHPAGECRNHLRRHRLPAVHRRHHRGSKGRRPHAR